MVALAQESSLSKTSADRFEITVADQAEQRVLAQIGLRWFPFDGQSHGVASRSVGEVGCQAGCSYAWNDSYSREHIVVKSPTLDAVPVFRKRRRDVRG